MQACGIWVGPPSTRSGQRVHDTLVIGNEVIGSAAAHVFAMSEHGGIWAFNFAHDGFADTFHHTGLSRYCQVSLGPTCPLTRCHTHCLRNDHLSLSLFLSVSVSVFVCVCLQVVGNRASNTPDGPSGTPTRGDDFFAFVGYAADGDPVHHCTAIGNWGRHGHARGLSAVVSGLSLCSASRRCARLEHSHTIDLSMCVCVCVCFLLPIRARVSSSSLATISRLSAGRGYIWRKRAPITHTAASISA